MDSKLTTSHSNTIINYHLLQNIQLIGQYELIFNFYSKKCNLTNPLNVKSNPALNHIIIKTDTFILLHVFKFLFLIISSRKSVLIFIVVESDIIANFL